MVEIFNAQIPPQSPAVSTATTSITAGEGIDSPSDLDLLRALVDQMRTSGKSLAAPAARPQEVTLQEAVAALIDGSPYVEMIDPTDFHINESQRRALILAQQELDRTPEAETAAGLDNERASLISRAIKTLLIDLGLASEKFISARTALYDAQNLRMIFQASDKPYRGAEENPFRTLLKVIVNAYTNMLNRTTNF